MSIRNRYPYENQHKPAVLSESRKSPRRKPEQPKDVRVQLGESSLEGTVYNVSEHGLGIAVLITQLESIGPFQLDEAVEIVERGQAARHRAHPLAIPGFGGLRARHRAEGTPGHPRRPGRRSLNRGLVVAGAGDACSYAARR